MAIIKTSWKKVNEDDKKDDYYSITPSGFKQKKYSKDVVLGKYLYHRCHVIGWNLGGIDVDENCRRQFFDENVPNRLIYVFAVRSRYAEIPFGHYSLDVNSELLKHRNRIVGVDSVCLFYDIANPASRFELLVRNKRILVCTDRYDRRQKLDEHEAHHDDYRERQ